MLVCRLAPILLIAILAATGQSSGGILYIVALLICSLGIIAMRFMGPWAPIVRCATIRNASRPAMSHLT